MHLVYLFRQRHPSQKFQKRLAICSKFLDYTFLNNIFAMPILLEDWLDVG